MERVWHQQTAGAVCLTFEGLSIRTKSGTVSELQAERDTLQRQIERKLSLLAKMDRMIETLEKQNNS